MNDLAPDEKLCPFCAETIKAAAVKCRYCGSDLEAVVQPDPESHTGRDAESHTGPDTEPETGPQRRLPGGPALAAVLAVLVAAAVIGCVVVGRHAWNSKTATNGEVTSEISRSVQLDQISRATARVLSYKAATFEDDSKKAQALMTASMKSEYLDTLAKVRKNVHKYGLTLTAKVAAIGLVSMTDDRAKALAFINQTTTAKDSKNTQVDQNRAIVTMDKTAVGWRISSIKPF